MQSERGASLFVVLLVCIAIVGAALFALPWYNNKRELARVEQMEADAMRGVPPASPSKQPSVQSSARELPDKLGAGDAEGLGFKTQVYPSEAEARVEAKRVADEKAFVRRSECEEQRRVLAKYRNKVITDDTAPNKKQVDQLEAIIAANC